MVLAKEIYDDIKEEFEAFQRALARKKYVIKAHVPHVKAGEQMGTLILDISHEEPNYIE